MAIVGKFCKAYQLREFRGFQGWKEDAHNARKVLKVIDGEAQEVERQLLETDYLYLQDNFTVTDGIFMGENIIFSDVTPEWIEFCQNILAFHVTPEQPVQLNRFLSDPESTPNRSS
jgi:hypothetical protein